ncbi:MAG: MaoC family dehydratase N-terminal domain-containing protein [Chloroflexi bacterium]|nr:MaoC family dehydratase N-terminal domain-containing protein [Chloroflexota bacterium]
MIDYATLEAGQPLTSQSITLDTESVSAYTAAVDDRSSPTDAAGAPLVPPMAIAALSLSAVINALQIPGGTIHASQELGFSAAVPVGATLDCSATVAQNSVRRNFRFLVVNMLAAGENGSVVMEGKSTIMLPV